MAVLFSISLRIVFYIVRTYRYGILFTSLFAFLVGTIGLPLFKHYCKGELITTQLFKEAKSCHQDQEKHQCPFHDHQEEEKDDCCSDELEIVHLDQDLPRIQNDIDFHTISLLHTGIQQISPQSIPDGHPTNLFIENRGSPPLIARHILFQQFRC